MAFSDDTAREQEMLKAREAGLGVTARPPDERETWEGWEDSAVPPERLGDYLRDLKKLFDEFGYDQPSLYGHFGQGCVHTRIPFELKTADGRRRLPQLPVPARPTWWSPTAVRCRASTATGRPAASCWPGCSANRWCAPSARSRRCSTRPTG